MMCVLMMRKVSGRGWVALSSGCSPVLPGAVGRRGVLKERDFFLFFC